MDAKGCIRVSRVSGDHDLFGSNISHHNFIEIEIRGAEESPSLGGGWTAKGDQLVKIAMSADQFISMFTTMNYADGVPCTILRFQGKQVTPYRREKTVIDVVQCQAEESRNNFRKRVKEAYSWVQEIAKTKKDKDKAARIFAEIETNLEENMRFYEKRFVEAGEIIKKEIVAEADAQISMMVERAGSKFISEKEGERRLVGMKSPWDERERKDVDQLIDVKEINDEYERTERS